MESFSTTNTSENDGELGCFGFEVAIGIGFFGFLLGFEAVEKGDKKFSLTMKGD